MNMFMSRSLTYGRYQAKKTRRGGERITLDTQTREIERMKKTLEVRDAEEELEIMEQGLEMDMQSGIQWVRFGGEWRRARVRSRRY